jgi:ribA/ribD-fused uncharacterized protein
MKEYLVPFGRVTEILKENGYELLKTTSFEDHYANQKDFTFGPDHQAFSFLHRSFVFKRVPLPEKPKVEEAKVDAEPVKAEPEPEPEEKKPAKKKIVKVAKDLPEPVFFMAGNEALNEYKELTNTYEAPMQIDGITFPTVEHYYQYSKAKMFGDADVEKKIMKTPSAKSVKGFGKKVKNFKQEEWDEKKDSIMKVALKAKFTQHPELKKKLLDTGDRPLAEANPRGKYWGIGTSADTSKAKDPAKWPGKNVLGKMLADLRTELKE